MQDEIPPQQPVTPPPAVPPASSDEKLWAMLCHLGALAGYVIPFGNVVGPLIVWMLKKQEFPAVDRHGKESLNFQISVSIYAVVAAILMFACIGFVLLPAVGVFALVMIILASMKANKGEFFRYPLTIRFIK